MTNSLIAVTQHGDTASKLREWSSVIGIVTAIIGNILISFALNIQRYAHIRLGQEQHAGASEQSRKHKGRNYGTQEQAHIAEDRVKANLNPPWEDGEGTQAEGEVSRRDEFMPSASLRSRTSSESVHLGQSEKSTHEEQRKSYLKSPYWWAGIVLMVIGEAGNFLAYGFAPASIVSPLGVVALVSNCIIAPCLLKERFRQRDFWGVTVAVAGAVVVVLSAKTSEPRMGPNDIWGSITRWEFELYLGTTAVLIIALMWASGKYGHRTILIDLGLVGLYGGYTALSTKGVASLLSYTLWHALTFPITYLLVFVLVTSALLQIRYVNRALQRFDSTQVIPTQFVLFTLSVIIGSTILYRDFESATPDRIGKFAGGCILTFLGVYLITSGRSHEEDGHGDDDLNDEENTIGLIDEERYQDEIEERRPMKDGFLRHESTNSIRLSNPPRSNRSSRQQSAGPSSPPRTPLRLSSSTSNPHETPRTPSPSALLENPWQSSQEQLSRPRPLESTISTPLLPTEAHISDPLTPNTTRRQPESPRRNNNRLSTLSRTSVVRMMPGPLISPLSSPLSAIVADSLRRGVDVSSPTAKRRPGLSALRKSKSQRSAGREEESSDDFAVEEGTQRPAMERRESTKGRSFSVSLGEFFRLNKGERSKSRDTSHEQEARRDEEGGRL